MIAPLALVFLAIAVIYSMSGLGGATAYLAIMSLWGIPIEVIPRLALVCNVLVAGGSALHFIRGGHFRPMLLAWLAAGSIPAAFIGGRMEVPADLLRVALGLTLLGAGLRFLLLPLSLHERPGGTKQQPPGRAVLTAVGAGLGLASGICGIGGGVFLGPLLLLARWASPKEAAALSSVFIVVNSISGLAGHFVRNPDWSALIRFWPCVAAAMIGGQLGGRIGAGPLPARILARATGALLLVAAARLVVVALK